MQRRAESVSLKLLGGVALVMAIPVVIAAWFGFVEAALVYPAAAWALVARNAVLVSRANRRPDSDPWRPVTARRGPLRVIDQFLDPDPPNWNLTCGVAGTGCLGLECARRAVVLAREMGQERIPVTENSLPELRVASHYFDIASRADARILWAGVLGDGRIMLVYAPRIGGDGLNLPYGAETARNRTATTLLLPGDKQALLMVAYGGTWSFDGDEQRL